jgi:5-methyltetrahydropteroyltriglutamate--homocysteine methyltransferase
LKTTVIGAFPKISDEAGGQHLRTALHKHDRGEIDDGELDRVYRDSTLAAISELEAAAIDVVNDGQIRWDDLFAPFAKAWSGVSRGPLERYYDNNTYFRQPLIEGNLETNGHTLVGDFTFARSAAKGELKAAICGPLSFAMLAIDKHYSSLEERTLAVADALAAEIRGLGKAGATLIDVEDPAIVASPQHIELAREAYTRLAAAGVPLALQTYFFPADRVLESLASFPVAQIGLDVRSRDTTVLRRLDSLGQKTVVLGVVDARNTRVETRDEVIKLVEDALKLVPADRLWLAPTTSLEFLPHDVVSRKLAVLTEAARAAGGVPA